MLYVGRILSIPVLGLPNSSLFFYETFTFSAATVIHIRAETHLTLAMPMVWQHRKIKTKFSFQHVTLGVRLRYSAHERIDRPTSGSHARCKYFNEDGNDTCRRKRKTASPTTIFHICRNSRRVGQRDARISWRLWSCARETRSRI